MLARIEASAARLSKVTPRSPRTTPSCFHKSDKSTVTGFEATGSGELSGRAVDADNQPLSHVEIHVVSKNWGEQIVKTDDDGNYKVVLKGASTDTSMIFVRGHRGAHLEGPAATRGVAARDAAAS